MARVDRGTPFSAVLALVLIVLAAIPRETTAGTSEASGPAPRGFRCGWPYPASLAPGTYTVKVGVFSGDWTTLYAWENQAATFAVE